MDLKEWIYRVVLLVGAGYTILLLLRLPTRFKATRNELILVYLILFAAFVMVPVFFSSISPLGALASR